MGICLRASKPRHLSAAPFLAAAIATTLAGCSTVGLLNATAPKAGVSVTRDVAYADGDRRGLDVYAPSGAVAGRPVVVFFYGGSWDSG